jgi:hypothetical protein
MRTILNFLRLLPVFALAFFIGSIAVALIHSTAPFYCNPGTFIGGVARGLGLLAWA